MTTQQYPWDALESALARCQQQPIGDKQRRYNAGTLARQLLDDLEQHGWRIVRDEDRP